jgi:chorismate--pyruvate lyase
MPSNAWLSRPTGGALDPVLASWLLEPGSLTARCQRNCQDFRVRLLRYGKGQALADEGLRLIQSRQPAWVREVVLECDGVPVIFAHTTLSTASRGRLSRWLSRLGSHSLGSLLFSHPGFSRGSIEFICLDRRHPLYQRAAAMGVAERQLWARRSLHRLGGQAVLVTEVFLPMLRSLSD